MTCNWESNNTDVETRDVFWSSTFEPQYFSAGTYKSSLRWQKNVTLDEGQNSSSVAITVKTE